MSDESIEMKVMRTMAWERAKGELRSMLGTYKGRMETFKDMDEAVKEFIEYIENEGLQE